MMSTFGDTMIAESGKWLGTPYAWGGGTTKGPSLGIRDGGVADRFGDYLKTGFDCSGLVLRCVYVASGGATTLPHRADIQRRMGQDIPFGTHQPGDLIAFSSDGGIFYHHIGIYLGNDMVRSAPQSGQVVRDDPITTWAKEKKVVRRFGDPGGATTPGTGAIPADAPAAAPESSGLGKYAGYVVIGAIAIIGAVIVFSQAGGQ